MKRLLILIIISYFFLMLGNGILSLTIPDEVFYAQTAKEMAQHHSWMTPYLFGQPQFEKPILLYWLLRIGFIFFGVSSFGARFFPALFGMIGVAAVYCLGLLGFKEEKKAFLSAVVLMSCGIYIGLARTVFTDLIFSVFILLALASFYWAYSARNRKASGMIFFFVFMALAVLTKGPLGFLIPFLSILLFLLFKKEVKFLFDRHSLAGFTLFLLISLPWYVFIIKRYGYAFTREFFYNDHIRRFIEAEHAGFDKWYFYPASAIGCIFPWSLFLIAALFRLHKYLKDRNNSFYVFLVCAIIIIFAVFEPAHSKLISYIFPLFPLFALITGSFIVDAASEKKASRMFLFASWATLSAILLVPLSLAVLVFGCHGRINAYIPPSRPFYYFITLFFAFDAVLLFFIIKGKLLKNAYCLALVIPAFLYFVPFVKSALEPYLSPRESCEYLLRNYDVKNTILTSKFLVRGVKYYTDKEVAVIAPYTQNFFSPHPLPFLDYDAKVSEFLRKQKVTYCIVKKSSLEDIERAAAKEFKYTVLKVIGNEYILRVEPA